MFRQLIVPFDTFWWGGKCLCNLIQLDLNCFLFCPRTDLLSSFYPLFFSAHACSNTIFLLSKPFHKHLAMLEAHFPQLFWMDVCLKDILFWNESILWIIFCSIPFEKVEIFLLISFTIKHLWFNPKQECHFVWKVIRYASCLTLKFDFLSKLLTFFTMTHISASRVYLVL